MNHENPIYEGMNDEQTIDFAISHEKKKYIVDIFNAKIEDTNQAYIDTIVYHDLETAKEDMQKYILRD